MPYRNHRHDSGHMPRGPVDHPPRSESQWNAFEPRRSPDTGRQKHPDLIPWGTAAGMYFRGLKPEDLRNLRNAGRALRQVRSMAAAARLIRAMALMGGTSVVVADDATGIGVVDDPLLAVSAFMVLNTLRKIYNIRHRKG